VPDYAEFDIDIRTIPSQNHQEICAHLEHYLKEEIELEASVDVGGVVSDASDPWVQDVFAMIELIIGSKPNVTTAKYF
jgi:acetylornithine deacetylase/succinyl-diaminopimelate desuccinylase-like protein